MSIEVVRDSVETKSLYWCGTLLMEGDFELDIPATLHEIDGGIVSEDDTGGFRKPVKTSAWKCWYPGPGRPSFWAARNRYYQQLDVTGLSFPAFTEEAGRDAVNEEQGHRSAWPGAVFLMADTEIRKVLESIQNHAIRPIGPPWHSFPGAKMVNYKHAHMPGCPGGYKLTTAECKICEELEKQISMTKNERALPLRNEPPEFRHRGDLPVADFIYLLKLNAPPETPKDFYSTLVPRMAEFIQRQPPPVSKDLAKIEAKIEKVA